MLYPLQSNLILMFFILHTLLQTWSYSSFFILGQDSTYSWFSSSDTLLHPHTHFSYSSTYILILLVLHPRTNFYIILIFILNPLTLFYIPPHAHGSSSSDTYLYHDDFHSLSSYARLHPHTLHSSSLYTLLNSLAPLTHHPCKWDIILILHSCTLFHFLTIPIS